MPPLPSSSSFLLLSSSTSQRLVYPCIKRTLYKSFNLSTRSQSTCINNINTNTNTNTNTNISMSYHHYHHHHHHYHTMCNPNSSLSSSSSFTLRSINQQNTTRLVSSTTSSTSSSTSSTRPFQILGLQQVAVGSTDPAALRHLWMDIFGLKKVNTHSSEKENVIEDILLIGGSLEGSRGQGQGSETHSTANSIGNIPVELDLMCPMDENKSPKVHKPPLNHIGLWVDDLSMAVQWMESKGVRFAPGGIRKGAAGYDVTFIHPKGNDESPIGGCGVLIELVQAPKSVIHALKK